MSAAREPLRDSLLNPKYAVIAQRLIEGKTQQEIEQELGVSQGYVSKMLSQKPQIKQTIREAMEIAGLTPDRLALKLSEGLEAHRVLRATQFAEREVVADFSERRQTVELVAKLRGDLQDGLTVNVNQVLAVVPAEFDADMAVTPGETIDGEATEADT